MAAVAISLAVGAAAGWLGSKLVKKSGKGDSDFEMWPQLASGKHEVLVEPKSNQYRNTEI